MRDIAITWHEDVRQWHPGQSWVWQAGGFGAFDPGINALSILTAIVAESIILTEAELEIPSNCDAPMAAQLALRTASGAPVTASLISGKAGRRPGISPSPPGNRLLLSDGGNRLAIDGVPPSTATEGEYPAMYRRLADLVHGGASDVDLAPLRLVADAFLCGRQCRTEAFYE